MSAEMDRLRERIDQVDRELVRLLNQRAGLALEIGRLKRQKGWPVYDPDRERKIFSMVAGASRGPLTAGAIRRLYERVLDESRRLEGRVVREGGVEGRGGSS